MWLSQKADYAVRLMVDLACLPDGDWTTVREVAQRQDIPERFMAKIVTQAVAAGLVTARRGTGGGLTIARAADSINLLEVVKAVEQPLALSKCTSEPNGCPLSYRCAVHPTLGRVQKQLDEVMAQTTLGELARAQKEMGQAHRVAKTYVENSPSLRRSPPEADDCGNLRTLYNGLH